MGQRLRAVAFLMVGILAGCSSTPPSKDTSNAARRDTSPLNAGNASAPGTSASPGGAQITDENSDPAANQVTAGKRRMVDLPANAEKGSPPAVPAPERSSVTMTMAKDGSFVETRVFAVDTDIAKVTRTANNASELVVVTLRNGRSVKLPVGRISSIKTVSLNELKALAGIKVPQNVTRSDRRENSQPKTHP